MSIPLISVIIPVFNRERTLGRAIWSLQAQTYTNWEALIVDDGTTDKSLALALSHARLDPRIRLLVRENGGVSAARNHALSYVRGSYITFLDSDDEYTPTHIHLRANYMEKHSEVDILEGGLMVIGNPYVPDRHDNSKLINVADCITAGTIFARSEAVKKVNGFRPIPYSEDADLIDRAQTLGLHVEHFSAQTYVYHREDNLSITRQFAHTLQI